MQTLRRKIFFSQNKNYFDIWFFDEQYSVNMSEKKEFKFKRYHIPNVVKALRVIEMLSSSHNGMTQLELSKACDFSQSIIFRLLCTLQDYEMVKKHADKNSYTISKKFLSIAYNSADSSSLMRDLSDTMLAIRDSTMETTMLGMMLDDNFVLLHQELGKYNFNYTCAIGMKANLHTAAPAKAMIAFMPESERKRIVAKIDFVKFNENTITNKRDYNEQLNEIRKNGYAVDRQEHVKGMNCLAIPILDACKVPIAAIWVTGPSDRLTESDFPDVAKKMQLALKTHCARQ